MVHFVGAGTGAVDLITVRGQRLIERADVIIYAGSLINTALLDYAKEISIPTIKFESNSSRQDKTNLLNTMLQNL